MILPHLDSCGIPEDIRIMGVFAKVYQIWGRWYNEQALRECIVEFMRQKYGEKHLDTLRSMANLATTYWNQGRWSVLQT